MGATQGSHCRRWKKAAHCSVLPAGEEQHTPHICPSPPIQVTNYLGHLEPEVKIVFVPGALKPKTWMASTLFAPGVSTFPICHPHYACGKPLPQRNIGCVKNPDWAPCEKCHSCPLFSLLDGSEPSAPPQYHQGHLSVSTKRSLFILPPDSILSCRLDLVG